MKRCSTSEKWGLKQQWDTTIPIRMAKIRNVHNIKCWWGDGVTRALNHCWWESKTVQPPWKVVSYKNKHTLTLWSSNHTTWYLSKGDKNLCPYRNLYTDIFSSFIHTCQNLSFIGEWMNCGTSRQRKLFSAEKKWAMKPWKNMEEN